MTSPSTLSASAAHSASPSSAALVHWNPRAVAVTLTLSVVLALAAPCALVCMPWGLGPAAAALALYAGLAVTRACRGFLGEARVVFPRSSTGDLPFWPLLSALPYLVVIWAVNAVRRKSAPPCSQILEFLWLGDRRAAAQPGWTQVIDMTCEYAGPSTVAAPYVCFPVMDLLCVEPDVLETAATCLDAALQSPNARVLVHCALGRWRSAQVVVYWLRTRRGMTAAQAWALVQAQRPVVQRVAQGHRCEQLAQEGA